MIAMTTNSSMSVNEHLVFAGDTGSPDPANLHVVWQGLRTDAARTIQYTRFPHNCTLNDVCLDGHVVTMHRREIARAGGVSNPELLHCGNDYLPFDLP